MKKIAVGLLSLVLSGCSSVSQPTKLAKPDITPPKIVKVEVAQSKAENIADKKKEREDRLVKTYLKQKVSILKELSDYLEMKYRVGISGYEISNIETKMNLQYFVTALKSMEKETEIDFYEKVYAETERRNWLFPTEDKEIRKEQIKNMLTDMKQFQEYAQRKFNMGVADKTDTLRTKNYILDLEFLMSRY